MKELLSPLPAAAAALSLALLVAVPAGAREADDECRATFDPARVAVQERPVTVNAGLSEPVDEVEDVAVQDGSGLVVRSVRPAGGPDGVTIVLDTSGAEPGEWTLTIEGPTTDCEGTLAVEEGPLARALPR